MYTKGWLIASASLWVWTSGVQGYALSPADPTITPAPEPNFLLQERQSSYVNCSQWDVPGYGPPVCNPGSTCFFQLHTTFGYANCGPDAAQTVDLKTACYDYGLSCNAANINNLCCSAANPACASVVFFSTGFTWVSNYCLTSSTIYTAFPAVATTPFTVISTTSSDSFPFSYPTPSDSGSFPTDSIPLPSSTPDPPSTKSNAAVIGGAVGGAVGGITVLVGAVLLFIFMRRRNRRMADAHGPGGGFGTAVEQPPPEYKSPSYFEPPAEYKAPATEVKPTTYVSEHC